MNQAVILKNYPSQNYKVLFDRLSGFFARIEDLGFKEPFWAKAGPELLDISITNWCDRGCSFCYRDSNINGTHMALEDYIFLMEQAVRTNVLQVALGGGNPNQHPEFEKILQVTRQDYDIVPSYTTNGRGLSESILLASEKYCGAIAVSAYEPYSNLKSTLKKISNYDIKVNIHFVLDSESISTAIEWLKWPLDFLSFCNAIIFLNYKPIGTNKDEQKLLNNSNRIEEFFYLINKGERDFKIGFDSCMVPGVVKYLSNASSSSVEPCDAGRFSAFVREDLKVFPCSFMGNSYGGISLKKTSLLDIWLYEALFQQTRARLGAARCNNCQQQSLCLNGCPFLETINIC